MSAHTPGPWVWRNIDGFTYLVGSNDVKIISAIGIDGDELDDDLIEAAPRLLEALQAILKKMPDLGEFENPQGESMLPLVTAADQAIAKATGKEPS
jgi:hypothetical protein